MHLIHGVETLTHVVQTHVLDDLVIGDIITRLLLHYLLLEVHQLLNHLYHTYVLLQCVNDTTGHLMVGFRSTCWRHLLATIQVKVALEAMINLEYLVLVLQIHIVFVQDFLLQDHQVQEHLLPALTLTPTTSLMEVDVPPSLPLDVSILTDAVQLCIPLHVT